MRHSSLAPARAEYQFAILRYRCGCPSREDDQPLHLEAQHVQRHVGDDLGGQLAQRFDRAQEEAALDLGASYPQVFWHVLLPFLKPALLSASVIAFLSSFENFNTTLMLVGSDPPLTVMMYGRMREGSSPVLNAVSLFLMLASALLALTLMRRPAEGSGGDKP